jgi:hypothetical protein
MHGTELVKFYDFTFAVEQPGVATPNPQMIEDI